MVSVCNELDSYSPGEISCPSLTMFKSAFTFSGAVSFLRAPGAGPVHAPICSSKFGVCCRGLQMEGPELAVWCHRLVNFPTVRITEGLV